MGNSSSDVNDSVKAQAGGEGSGPPILKIVNLNGSGELIELWKEALVRKEYDQVDAYLRDTLPSWMYNDGNGENVILLLRFLHKFLLKLMHLLLIDCNRESR